MPRDQRPGWRRVRNVATVAFVGTLWLTPIGSAAFGAATALDDSVATAAEQIAGGLRQQRLTVAVPDLGTLDGRATVLGRYIAEELLTALFARGVQVVERSLLDRALSELQLGMTDLMNPTEVKRFGRLVGAQAIIVGTLTDLGQTVKLNARVVEVETGQVIGAASTVVEKDASVSSMLGQTVPPRRLTTPTPRSGASREESGDPVFWREDFSNYEDGDALPSWGADVIVRKLESGRSYIGSLVPGTHAVRQTVRFPPNFSLEFDMTMDDGHWIEFALILVDEKGDELRVGNVTAARSRHPGVS